jgi:hypothetical protein
MTPYKRTYSSAALAFKDAEYACAVHRFPRNTLMRRLMRLLWA